MANLEASGMKSLGQYMSIDGHNNDYLKQAHSAVLDSNLKLADSTTPVRHSTIEEKDTSPSVLDMPLREATVKKAKYLFDLMRDTQVEGDHDMKMIIPLMKAGAYNQLPLPLRPKGEIEGVGYQMQLKVEQVKVEDENNPGKTKIVPGKYNIIKWFQFQKPQDVAQMKDILIHGVAHQPHWVHGAQTVTKTMHYIFERIPGHTFLYNAWADEVRSATKKVSTDADKQKRMSGFEFIRTRGPKANNQNQFVEWTENEINDTNSPIYGWSVGLVKESLRNYATGTVGAKTLQHWAISMKKFHPQFLDNVVIPMLRTHDRHSINWIGKTRVGKSTASKTTCFNISAYQIDKHGRVDLVPSIVTGKKVDFFRLEPGSIFKPAIMDDLILPKLAQDEYKAMGDPSEEDALLWARWGGTSMEMNQARHFCYQNYDKAAEPKKSASTIGEAIKLGDFLKMIQCNWPHGSLEEDIDAYLNRGHFVLLTDNWIYWKMAMSPKTELIPRMKWPGNPEKPDLFIPESIPIAKAYKKDQTMIPTDYAADLQWGVALIKALMRGKTIPKTLTFNGTDESGRKTVEYRHPTLEQLNLLAAEDPEVLPEVNPLREYDVEAGVHIAAPVEEMPDDEDPFGFAGARLDDGNGALDLPSSAAPSGAAPPPSVSAAPKSPPWKKLRSGSSQIEIDLSP